MRRRAACILTLAGLLAAGCAPVAGGKKSGEQRPGGKVDYSAIPRQVEGMLPRVRAHVKALAGMGPRQTGQAGCDLARSYIARQLEDIAAHSRLEMPLRDFTSTVTVAQDRTRSDQHDAAEEPFTHITVEGLPGGKQRWPAHSLAPNCAQACATHRPEDCPLKTARAGAPCPYCDRPRRLVDLGHGDWDDFRGKDLTDAVVLLEFNSNDAWLRAASLGAAEAIFIEPALTTVFQADSKYLATVPLHFPRVYVRAETARRLREALAAAPDALRVTVSNRLRFENAPAKSWTLTIPGRDRGYCFVLAAHFDARGIVPDLAYGAAELWGVAELIELTRHFSQNQPACDIQVIFTSGHWQSQRGMRDYLASLSPDGRFAQMGTYYRVVMGVDMVPAGKELNLIIESPWDIPNRDAYQWIGRQLLEAGGWREQFMKGLGLDKDKDVQLWADARPVIAETRDGVMALRNDLSPAIFTPLYPTAEGPWQTLGLTTMAFQTSRLTRMEHNTPLDRLEGDPLAGEQAGAIDDQLRPQLQMAVATLAHLQQYPVGLMPLIRAGRHRSSLWGGYAQITGQVQLWSRATGWFEEALPEKKAQAELPKARSDVERAREALAGAAPADLKAARHELDRAAARLAHLTDEAGMRTFLYAFPSDRSASQAVATGSYSGGGTGKARGQLPWPRYPDRAQHRELQSFMFQELHLLETHSFRLNTVYARAPSTQYNVLAYTIDQAGNIRYATDFGVKGDGSKSFRCTDLDLDTWDLNVPVSIFECGSLELFDLLDPQRYNPAAWVYPAYMVTYSGQQPMTPYLGITGVKDVDSHTDVDSWGYAQYASTAMVFLPANHFTGIEVLLGTWFTNFAVLNNPRQGDAGEAKPEGYRLAPGQTLRLASGKVPGALACASQLTDLNNRRVDEFRRYDVVSPLALQHQGESDAALKAGREAQTAGDWQKALAEYMRGWIFESNAYRNTVGLLLDVVSTTVLYFVLLIPFSFLVERLVFPQRTVLRTALVSVTVFAVFAAVLYLFHPGFKLAHNVVVTVTAFVIVVMTIPALVLLLVRGVAMLRAIGSKSVITQQSEAESAGVVMAALSLAVSNMRRRRLRTALTLVTITTLVVALVLLTTSSAFDFKIIEPGETNVAGLQAVQVFNARDRRLPLLKETAELYQAALHRDALVIPRECINYGYADKIRNGALLLRAGPRRTEVPYIQVMDARDNHPLAEYTLHDGQASRRLHLGDLMEGRFLAPGEADACLLPNTMADRLQVKVGQTVTLMGLPLVVRGIWQAEVSTRSAEGKMVSVPGPLDRLVDLDGQPITAMDAAKLRDAEPDAPIHVPSTRMIILPREWVRRYAVFPTEVYSLIVIPHDSRQDPPAVARWGDRLAREILNVEVFSHYVDPATQKVHATRVSMLSATHVKGSSLMFVIMGVAVLMILSIMTGTVYERMREIHIFSSVGLSPRHVAGMFLIEALVYAGIAAVLGYFIGIVALKALLAYLKSTGQHQDFYPNYLGVFVLYSIGLAVLATVASSLYPIRLASKIVNPSAAAASWQADATGDDDHWAIRLPFIATTWDEARAMMVYAYDFLAMHQGERSGRFVCEAPPAGAAAGQRLRLIVPVWLAPFERNLSQQTELSIAPVADAPWWAMSLLLRRVSGPPYLWRRGASVFVNRLTKHLLRWRAASAQQEAECLSRASEVFPEE